MHPTEGHQHWPPAWSVSFLIQVESIWCWNEYQKVHYTYNWWLTKLQVCWEFVSIYKRELLLLVNNKLNNGAKQKASLLRLNISKLERKWPAGWNARKEFISNRTKVLFNFIYRNSGWIQGQSGKQTGCCLQVKQDTPNLRVVYLIISVLGGSRKWSDWAAFTRCTVIVASLQLLQT